MLVLFCGWQCLFDEHSLWQKEIPPVAEKSTAALLAFGDQPLLARGMAFWLQTFDSQAGQLIPYHQLNYVHLLAWLSLICELDPAMDYPLLMATRVFSETKDPARLRQVIGFVREQYRVSPLTRWRWQAEAAILARHRLKDLSLALALSKELASLRNVPSVPYWVKDMEHLILAELGEYESAARVISSLLREGMITDPNEIRFLAEKLKGLRDR